MTRCYPTLVSAYLTSPPHSYSRITSVPGQHRETFGMIRMTSLSRMAGAQSQRGGLRLSNAELPTNEIASFLPSSFLPRNLPQSVAPFFHVHIFNVSLLYLIL